MASWTSPTSGLAGRSGSDPSARASMAVKLLLALLLVLLDVPALAQQPAVASIGVEGTEIVVWLADGRSLRSRDLVGATLDVRFEGEPAKVRVAGVEAD